MGSITDAPDGKAVAGSVFTAVGVYGVSFPTVARARGRREERADHMRRDRSSSSSADCKHSYM